MVRLPARQQCLFSSIVVTMATMTIATTASAVKALVITGDVTVARTLSESLPAAVSTVNRQ